MPAPPRKKNPRKPPGQAVIRSFLRAMTAQDLEAAGMEFDDLIVCQQAAIMRASNTTYAKIAEAQGVAETTAADRVYRWYRHLARAVGPAYLLHSTCDQLDELMGRAIRQMTAIMEQPGADSWERGMMAWDKIIRLMEIKTKIIGPAPTLNALTLNQPGANPTLVLGGPSGGAASLPIPRDPEQRELLATHLRAIREIVDRPGEGLAAPPGGSGPGDASPTLSP